MVAHHRLVYHRNAAIGVRELRGPHVTIEASIGLILVNVSRLEEGGELDTLAARALLRVIAYRAPSSVSCEDAGRFALNRDTTVRHERDIRLVKPCHLRLFSSGKHDLLALVLDMLIAEERVLGIASLRASTSKTAIHRVVTTVRKFVWHLEADALVPHGKARVLDHLLMGYPVEIDHRGQHLFLVLALAVILLIIKSGGRIFVCDIFNNNLR